MNLLLILSNKLIAVLCIFGVVLLIAIYFGIRWQLERITIYGTICCIKESTDLSHIGEDGSYSHIRLTGDPNEYPIYNTSLKGVKEGDYIGIRKYRFENIFTKVFLQIA